MQIVYRFQLDDAAFFGPEAELSDIDVKASYANYSVMVHKEIQGAYPDAQVSVGAGPDQLTVDGQKDHPELDALADIIDEVWGYWGWVVQK